jgi:hypothetical protein
MSIARLPFLPGVVDTADPTYTVTGTSITGFVSSGVAHICAAVPTTRNLIRYCQNGFKMSTKPTSSYAAEGTQDSTSRRSYKSLQDKKDRFGTAQQRSKASSRDPKDPYRLSTIMDAEDDGRFVELRPIQSSTHTDTQLDEDRGGQQVKGAWTEHVEEQLPTIVRESPSPGFDDSASNKAILHNDPYL